MQSSFMRLFLTGRAYLKAMPWIDEQNKVVVFLTIDEACKLINIGHNTATKIFKELDDYGLIERKKQGFARANIIYPKLPQPTEK